MSVDDFFHSRKPQARAVRPGRLIWLEDAGETLGRDSFAGVANLDLGGLPVALGPHHYLAMASYGLLRVQEQIEDRLLEHSGVYKAN
jgi:hypothetical protein